MDQHGIYRHAWRGMFGTMRMMMTTVVICIVYIYICRYICIYSYIYIYCIRIFDCIWESCWPRKSIDPQPYGSLMAASDSLALFKITRNLWFLCSEAFETMMSNMSQNVQISAWGFWNKTWKTLSMILSWFQHVLNLVSLSQIIFSAHSVPFHSLRPRFDEVSSTLTGQEQLAEGFSQHSPRLALHDSIFGFRLPPFCNKSFQMIKCAKMWMSSKNLKLLNQDSAYYNVTPHRYPTAHSSPIAAKHP